MSSRTGRSELLPRVYRPWRRAARLARACSGFTLIEAVISLAVLAIVLGAIGGLVGTTVKGARSVDGKLFLLETAQSLLAALPQRDALQPGTQTGVSNGLRWRMDVVPLAPQEAQPLAQLQPPDQTQAPARWIPLVVTLRVQGSAGPAVRLDTVRLVPRVGG